MTRHLHHVPINPAHLLASSGVHPNPSNLARAASGHPAPSKPRRLPDTHKVHLGKLIQALESNQDLRPHLSLIHAGLAHLHDEIPLLPKDAYLIAHRAIHLAKFLSQSLNVPVRRCISPCTVSPLFAPLSVLLDTDMDNDTLTIAAHNSTWSFGLPQSNILDDYHIQHVTDSIPFKLAHTLRKHCLHKHRGPCSTDFIMLTDNILLADAEVHQLSPGLFQSGHIFLHQESKAPDDVCLRGRNVSLKELNTDTTS